MSGKTDDGGSPDSVPAYKLTPIPDHPSPLLRGGFTLDEEDAPPSPPVNGGATDKSNGQRMWVCIMAVLAWTLQASVIILKNGFTAEVGSYLRDTAIIVFGTIAYFVGMETKRRMQKAGNATKN